MAYIDKATWKCADCGRGVAEGVKHQACGLCRPCYERHRKRGTIADYPTSRAALATWKCVDCGRGAAEGVKHKAHGLCARCDNAVRYKRDRDTFYSRNRERILLRCAERYKRDGEVLRARVRDAHTKRRRELFMRMGNRCVCCGLDDIRFLTVDHIHGDGHKERRNGRRDGNSGTAMYRKLLRDGIDPTRYQLLCYNCNCAKRNNKHCPHQLDREAAAQTQTLRERYAAFR